jgi:hypothetical protein
MIFNFKLAPLILGNNMKKIFAFLVVLSINCLSYAQEIYANVQVNHSQIGGSNTQVFKTLEKSLRDFINNTNWTGKKLQNFEKIKANFAIVIKERPSQNSFKGNLIVQAVRPVYGTIYETPLININDTRFSFEYTENENLIFNDRQFSGKNLTDVISFYIYTILGYDADSFQLLSGKTHFEKAQKISQNAQNQNYDGWEIMGETKSRSLLVNSLLNERSILLRNIYYSYHRIGLDNLSSQNQFAAKQTIAEELLKLKAYETNFQLNYPLSIFIDTKKDEIFNIFNSNNNGGINVNELRIMMSTFSPRDTESKWNKWK